MPADNNTLETYIVKQITRLNQERLNIKATKGTPAYDLDLMRISSQINILHQCLTAHDNKLAHSSGVEHRPDKP